MADHASSESDLSGAWLVWGFLFGAIGLSYFIYGKKQQAMLPMLCGFSLMIYPYFVSNVMVLIAIGVTLMGIPYFMRD